MADDFKPFLSGGPLKQLLLIIVSLVALAMTFEVEQRSLAWRYEYPQVSLHEPVRALFTLAEGSRRETQSGKPRWLLEGCSLCSPAGAERAFANLLEEGQRYRAAGFHKKWGRDEIADTKAARAVVLAGWGDRRRFEQLKTELSMADLPDFMRERAIELIQGNDSAERARIHEAGRWGFGWWSRALFIVCALALAVAYKLGFRYPRRAERCHLAAPDLWRGLLIFVWARGLRAALTLLRWDDPDGILSVFAQMPSLLPTLTVITLLIFTCRRRGETPVASLLACPPDLRSRRAVVLLAVATTGGLFLFWRIAMALGAPLGLTPSWSDSVRESMMFGTSGEAAAAVISASLLTPLAEELLFRGVLFGSLAPRLGVHRAALLSAAVFSLFHGYGILGSAFIFASGYAWARLDARTGTLVPSLLSHGFINIVLDVGRLLAR